MGKSRDAIGSFIQQSVDETGVSRIVNLISLLEMMATTDEYELLASIGFTESVNSSDFERFDKVYQYMMKNFMKPIKLEEVASLVGLTPNAFCRAKKLLIEGRMKISTLSMESGFNNLSNFIEQFKRSTQMSPSEYQKKFGVKNRTVI